MNENRADSAEAGVTDHVMGDAIATALVLLLGNRQRLVPARSLEDTYFRWLRRTDDQLRAVFDEYDLKAAQTA